MEKENKKDSAQKTNINPACLQQMLESAVNAADKGQSQFFTPIDFGQALAGALPKVRPTIVDLNCGNGQLLQASANPKTTISLLGSDIDPCHCLTTASENGRYLPVTKIAYDATRLYPLLKEIGFTADCFVLNPPWRLFWYRDRLQDLTDSPLSAVREAFRAIEPGSPKGCIDSTIATLLMALDLCTVYGEGLLIANNNTLERLLFRPDATHAAVAKHIWAHVVIPGNPMTGIEDCQWKNEEQFHTGIIYFAREHTAGPKRITLPELQPTSLNAQLRLHRLGADLAHAHRANENQQDLWRAAKDRVIELEGGKPRVQWNLWLTVGGRIKTALSAFQECSKRVNKKEAARLFALDGKAPMELVLQRNQRDELLHVAENRGTGDFPWRIQPELLTAVRAAIMEYHGARAPLYPLPPIQRLGYLDEQDSIVCEKDLLHPNGRLAFIAGRAYCIRTQTVTVTRSLRKPNAFTGEMEELELTGQELAIYLLSTEILPDKPKKGDDAGTEFCFMDAALKNDKKTSVNTAKQAKGRSALLNPEVKDEANSIDFTLQQLCDHFTIPEVPDVATVNPIGYEANLKLLEELETVCP